MTDIMEKTSTNMYVSLQQIERKNEDVENEEMDAPQDKLFVLIRWLNI